MNRQEQLLAGGGRRGGRWQSWRMISNRRWRASYNFTHTWCWELRFCFPPRTRCTFASLKVHNMKFACRVLIVFPKNTAMYSQQLCQDKDNMFLTPVFSIDYKVTSWKMKKIWTHSLLECCKSMSEGNGTVSPWYPFPGRCYSHITNKRHGLHVDRNTQRQTEQKEIYKQRKHNKKCKC